MQPNTDGFAAFLTDDSSHAAFMGNICLSLPIAMNRASEWILIIGAFQLRNDDRLSEEFLETYRLSFRSSVDPTITKERVDVTAGSCLVFSVLPISSASELLIFAAQRHSFVACLRGCPEPVGCSMMPVFRVCPLFPPERQ